jgi:hypothetical protein
LKDQLDILLISPLKEVDSVTGPIVVVIDALDECADQEKAKKLVQLLFVHLPQLSFTVKLLVTSRREDHILAMFKRQSHAQFVLHDVEASVVQGDIHKYLEANLQAIPAEMGLCMSENWIKKDDVDALVLQAGKLFIYAATVIQFTKDPHVKNPQKQLDIILKTTVTKKEHRPYLELDLLYLALLRNTISSRNSDVTWFQDIVGPLVVLRDALPLGSFLQLVKLNADSNYDDQSIRNDLSRLQSVILIPESNNGYAQVYHPSFPDFVVDDNRCTDSHFLISQRKHDKQLSICCFKLMKQYLKQNLIGEKNPRKLNVDIENLEEKLKESLPLEAQYACHFWASHLSSSFHSDNDLLFLLEMFAFKQAFWWIEAMSLLNSIPLAVTCIQLAKEWAVSTL